MLFLRLLCSFFNLVYVNWVYEFLCLQHNADYVANVF